MPCSSWRRNSVDQPLLVLGDLGVAFGDQLLAVARAHAQELHGRIMSRALRRLGAVSRRRASPDGRRRPARRPGPAPGRSRADRRDGLARRSPRRPRRLERREAERQVGGQRARVGAARAVRGAVGVALAGNRVELGRRRRTGPTTSSRWPPVTTTFAGRASCSARASSSTSSLAARPRSTRASGTFGVITVARGSSSVDDRRSRLVVEQHGAGLGDHHRVDDNRHAVVEGERLAHGAHGLGGAEHADLHGVDADVLGDGPDLLDDESRRDRVDRR